LCCTLLGALAAAPMAQDRTAPPVATRASVRDLIEKLGDDSYRARRDSEASLAELGAEALEPLQDAAENHTDAEVRWRARRLVRQIEQGRPEGLQRRGAFELQAPRDRPRMGLFFPGFGGGRDLDEIFERVFGELERDFGMDIQRQRFFEDDFFKDLEEQMAEVRRRREDTLRGGILGPGWNFDSSSQGVSVTIGPDGVRLEIDKKNEEGETEREVYEAPDMEAFRENYPEIAEQYMTGYGGRSFLLGPEGFRVFGIRPNLRLQSSPLLRNRRGDTQPRVLDVVPEEAIELTPPPEGKRLGVLIQGLAPDDRDDLGLDEGVGLLVVEVQGDTLAEDLGVREGDIVLEIGGLEIRGVEDVQEALGAIKAGEPVPVVVNRQGQRVELAAEKRKSAEVDSGLKPRVRIR
jgi:hypothetical protein